MSWWTPRGSAMPVHEIAFETMDALDSWKPSAVVSVTNDSNEKPECAFDGCTIGWMKKFRRRARPVFEGEWGCSRDCVRGIVEAAVRREMEGANGADVADDHQHRIPLGLMLLAQGLVTKEQLRTALEAQKSAGHGRIGRWLVEAAGVPAQQITRDHARDRDAVAVPGAGVERVRCQTHGTGDAGSVAQVVWCRSAAGGGWTNFVPCVR